MSCEVPSPGEVGGHVILSPAFAIVLEQKYVVRAQLPSTENAICGACLRYA